MQRLEVSGAVRPIYGTLGVKRLIRSWQDDQQPDSVAHMPYAAALVYAAIFKNTTTISKERLPVMNHSSVD